ncbi:two-component sensor histidine kinase [Streptomyces agglomeratus]|uniref:histidine kinase n=1 Tax=Streptomyces agglomeratus TaxID=285458 RepID=A0A1E5P731_9ACTN|nr:HAMP domain-containing sensor histidine kinase [Streptomyces agglomeratus]OEJ25329.1 two-component sensor histidine kinase [Streptomyces agglomeratus]OEJ40636.1 two-component sensor histidine kinase [Streptomyces agglomeratus]OEJ44984.1 two-component sensor histidine kinase [Streptomyces agglomeratus]OEJ53182.1 two-component sensor histidine kinase [Streptomyces agglomeratus]OEJ60519.1 two-component sensor histidine kinase [Streptomyces agglomeratus]
MSPAQVKSSQAGPRWTSLRLRLVVVFALVALTAAVSASGIAYWLNREAVLTRTQDAALNSFRQEMQNRAATLPLRPTQAELQAAATQMAAGGSPGYNVLLVDEREPGKPIAGTSDIDALTLEDVPRELQDAVNRRQKVTEANEFPYHLYWVRISPRGKPSLVAGTKVIGGGPTGYMVTSLEQERDDLNSLAWSLAIATALALLGSALLAQAAATTVLKPVQRLGDAARRLGEGKLDTRLRVSGTDELAELSRTFNKAAESLEKKVADMSAREESSRRFVADMSHELRTPLTAITAVAEVLEDEADNLDPMIAPAVHLVVSETRRLNDLVENLMEVTRFDAGTARLVLDDVDVADQVTACIDARAWLDAVDLDAERGIVARLDPRRLDVILANLIGNALKHGGSPVRVSVRPVDHELLIEVRDHGPGIPEDVLPHVFDRFYKASASRPRSEGSGLGLSIAMENAHIHGGDITASNSPEGGAVFVLRLPLDVSRAADGNDEGDDGVRDGQEGDGR